MQADRGIQRLHHHLGHASYAVYILHIPLVQLIVGMNVVILKIDPVATRPFSGLLLAAVILLLSSTITRYFDEPVRRYLVERYRSRHRLAVQEEGASGLDRGPR